ncbi:hypothetical protein V8J82_06765 [Gymnodinialimonas sp. 2305UL16-5]
MTATLHDRKWDAPDHWAHDDKRTRAERYRDSRDQRRWLRQTGIL